MARDDDLVHRAKAGDQDAWRELYTAHAGRLVVWLHTLTGGDAAVSPEDLASEAWLTAADKIGGFEGSSSDFAGYLFGSALMIVAAAVAWRYAIAAERKSLESVARPLAFVE
jgi:RNA polymerase sigma-70 factor (ECF subfamily)